MVQRVLLLLGSAAAWFTSPTDDDLRTWLGAHPPYRAQTEAEARLGIESWQHCRSIRSRPETVISQSEARIAPSQPMRSRDWEAPERSQSSPEPRRRVRLVEPERPHREPRTLRLREQGKQE